MPTNVNIQNGSDSTLSLATSVQPALGGDYWGIYNDIAAAELKTPVLWMDRNVGITKGDTWIFSTVFQFDGTAIVLEESLTGTTASSDIKIRITANAQDSGWSDEDTSLQFQGADGDQYQIDGSFFRNGSYDDVTYTLVQI
jgi:hypothetical protein